MTEKTKAIGTRRTDSKYRNMLLIILAGLFTFGAPYVIFMASEFLKGDVFFSFAGGIVSLAIGLLLILYLIKRKIIT